jgi:hypothetical protein
MVKIVAEAYCLPELITYENGKLFKNENVYNLIMSYMFRKTKIKLFIVDSIRLNYHTKIILFEQKL